MKNDKMSNNNFIESLIKTQLNGNKPIDWITFSKLEKLTDKMEILKILENNTIKYDDKLEKYHIYLSIEEMKKINEIIETKKQIKQNRTKKLPDIMKLSQNHQTNSIQDTIAGGKNLNIQKRTSKITFDKYSKQLIVSIGGEKYSTKITIENFIDIKNQLKPNLAKLLDLIFYNLNKWGNTSEFTVIEYLKYCGRKITINTRKDAQKEIKKYLQTLHSMKLEGNNGGNTIMLISPFSKVALLNGGRIQVNIDNDIAKSLENSYFEIYKDLGQLSGTAYFIASYIFRHIRFKKMWKFNLKNETLYQYSGLPRYENVKNGKGEISKLIIDPFHKAIKEIQDIFKDKIIMTQEEFNSSSWDSFRKASIEIDVPEFKEKVNMLINQKTKAIKKIVKRKKHKN